jgi:hypothetical protein
MGGAFVAHLWHLRSGEGEVLEVLLARPNLSNVIP